MHGSLNVCLMALKVISMKQLPNTICKNYGVANDVAFNALKYICLFLSQKISLILMDILVMSKQRMDVNHVIHMI